jgi:hypothetical protein
MGAMEPESLQTPSVQGLPSRYGRESRRRLRAELGCLIPLLLFFGLGTWLYAALVVYEPSILGVLGLLVFGVPFCLFGSALISQTVRTIRDRTRRAAAHIVPYFDRPLELGPEDAPTSGFVLARHCRSLDAVAAKRGVTTLTGLGLDDDLSDESPRWRDPEKGLATVRALLDELDASPGSCGVTDREALRVELKKLELALVKAQQHGASFCLLLRISRDTRVRPGGVDLSTGSFW